MSGDALGALERALATDCRVDEVEICLVTSHTGSTRFADSTIIQSASLADRLVRVRCAIGRRLGAAWGSSLDREGLEQLVARAAAAAASAPEGSFGGFADPSPLPPCGPSFDEATAALDAKGRAERCAHLFAQASAQRLAGALATGTTELAVATTRGVRLAHRISFAKLELIATAAPGSGYATTFGRALPADLAPLCEAACEKAATPRAPIELVPGRYDVLLEPPAVAEALEWMAMTAFGSRALEEGTSFLAGRAGQRITSEAVTWTDEGAAGTEGLPALPFDFEGTPKRAVSLVDRGHAGSPVADLASRWRGGGPSTGHAAFPSGETEGSAALHVTMAPGTLAREELLQRLGRGLLVTRFHYVNGLLDPRRAVQTGLTRDGLFWVDQGRIQGRLPDLRWNEPMLEAFARMDGASRERQAIAASVHGLGGTLVPTVLLRDFHFTARAGRG